VLRYQLRTQLEGARNGLENLPQRRVNAKANQTQAEMVAQQRLRNAETEKAGAEAEIERIKHQQDQQLASLDAHRLQLEGQRENLERQLERPDERLNIPRQVLEQQLDQQSAELANLPVQRANIEAQTDPQLQQPRERLRTAELGEAQAKNEAEQAGSAFAQEEGGIEASGMQLASQIKSLEGRLAEIDSEELEESGAAEEERQRLRSVEEKLASLDEKLAEADRRLEQGATIAKAKREELSTSAAGDLGAAYGDEAARHSNARKLWLSLLTAAILFAGGAGAAAIALAHPARDATNGEIATALAIQILVVGLAIYLVRVAASQFRAHSHLEAVNRRKAAALATFNRMVAGPAESDVRTAVASVLAQTVFGGEETGFIDGSADSVTLVEQAISPVLQKLGPG
jgi:hypothetical protein